MATKNAKAEFTLTLKDNNYKGETFTQFVGSFVDGRDTYLVSISTDNKGSLKVYKSEKGNEFIYARAVKFQGPPDGKRKRKSEM